MQVGSTVRRWSYVLAICLHAVMLFSTKAIAQNAIPFAYDVIDAAQPLHSHCKAVGDIDGDGMPDVVIASGAQGYGFYWYRYPDWNKYTIVPPGTGYTTDMQVGDIDNDGDLDIIVTKGYDEGTSAYWYENPRPSSDPATATWIEHAIGSAVAHDVEVADLNNDGKLDVVVRKNVTTVFIQNSPTSWTKNPINTRSIEGLSLGDIDGDGDIDAATNGYWLENPLPGGNPASGSWSEYVVVSGWPAFGGVHISDLNADGRADVVLGPSETQGRLSWFEGPANPKGGPWVEHTIGSNVAYLHTFKTADMDLDGDLDLVTAEMLQSNDPDEVVVWLNDGGAAAWTKQVVATTGSHNLRLADIGSDGDIDIIGANWQGTTPIEMWHNELNPSVSLDSVSLDSWERHVVDADKGAQAVFIDAGDLNNDSRLDIITGKWWYNNPGAASGTWSRAALGSPLNNMAAVHDFDEDGDLDVLGTEGVGSNSNPNMVWARNNGSGSFTILDNVLNGPGDFLQGVVVGRFQNGGPIQVALSWHISNGVQQLTLPNDPVNENWAWAALAGTSQEEQLSAGDIDRDGDLDLLLGTKWLRNDGGSWTAFTISSTSSMPDRNRLADINGDGRLDAVVGFEFESKLTWYEQGPTATNPWTEHTIATDFYAPMSLDVGDLDRDGDIDVVAGEHNLASPASARVHVFENQNNGTSWAVHLVSTGDEHHDGTRLVDIDNDNDLDIISIGWSHNRVLLYENTSPHGGGTPTNHAPIAVIVASPTFGAAPLLVSFSGESSPDLDEDPLTYAWNFGDQTTATGAVVNHTYAFGGTYVATLTVSDGSLQSSTTHTTIVTGSSSGAGLLAYWKLDETAGTRARDTAGRTDGTALNGPLWQPLAGVVDGALQFDGIDDVVSLGPLDVPGNGLTIAFWARAGTGGAADGRFVSKASGVQDQDHYWMVSLLNGTALRFRVKAGGTTDVLVTPTATIQPATWYHVAATYDGSAMRICVNGTEVASLPKTGALDTNPAIFAALGNQPPGAGSRPFSGSLDDVRIYDRALTAAEIMSLIEAPTGIVDTPSLVRLFQNSPNPFNPSTDIRYLAPAGTRVSLQVFDVSGRLITTLVDDAPGYGDAIVRWNGDNSQGGSVASGVYFYVLRVGGATEIRKMTLLK